MRTTLVTLIVVLLLAVAAAPAAALSGGAVQSYILTCESITITHDSSVYDRDNTGSGFEAAGISIIDGTGAVLFSNGGAALIGTLSPAGTTTYTFNTPPTANPIHLTFTSSDGNGLDKQVMWDIVDDCPDLPPSPKPVVKVAGAPGIPAGFVLAVIGCDVPVYNTPAGQPVDGAAITAGQTWYVNPEPVDGDDGRQWTEIYVSSTTNPYIPADCVS